MTSRVFGIAALFLAACFQLQAAASVRAFGLEFTVITNAVIRTNGYEITVEQVPPMGDDGTDSFSGEYGISAHLGQAQSGVYVYPASAFPLFSVDEDGRSMWGNAYGSVNGNTNTLISFIRGRRDAWGEYSVQVDFSALGATSYTYQVWCHGIRMLHSTNHGPDSGVSTISVEDRAPRVNPFVRTELGIGALIEFPNRTHFFVQDGGSGVGDRFFIIAEGVTNHVDYLSRVDIFGSEDLEAFIIAGAAVGMFGLPHHAMGLANWSAAGGRLGIGPFRDAGSEDPADGFRVDFKNGALNWIVQTEPFALAQSNAIFDVSASGLSSAPGAEAFLAGGLTKSNGTAYVYGDFWEFGSNAVLHVFRSHVLSGTVQGPNRAWLASLAATNPVITGWQVSTSSIALLLAEPTTFSACDGQMLEGDRFELAPAPSSVRIGHLFGGNARASHLEGLTIIAESAEPVPVPEIRLHIARSPGGVTITGPWHPCYFLATRNSFASNTSWQLYGSLNYSNFGGQITFNPTNRMQFYQLIDYYNWVASGAP